MIAPSGIVRPSDNRGKLCMSVRRRVYQSTAPTDQALKRALSEAATKAAQADEAAARARGRPEPDRRQRTPKADWCDFARHAMHAKQR
jgi:hypothetical protein